MYIYYESLSFECVKRHFRAYFDYDSDFMVSISFHFHNRVAKWVWSLECETENEFARKNVLCKNVFCKCSPLSLFEWASFSRIFVNIGELIAIQTHICPLYCFNIANEWLYGSFAYALAECYALHRTVVYVQRMHEERKRTNKHISSVSLEINTLNKKYTQLLFGVAKVDVYIYNKRKKTSFRLGTSNSRE